VVGGGDGSFCFSGPQPLWSMARYQAPVTVVLDNRSYNNERNRIWQGGGRQFKTGRDMTCYIGSPTSTCEKAAGAWVEGEAVKEPGEPGGDRAPSASADGRPYLLDVHTSRDGIGAASTWHPPFSVADVRNRRV
jgi:thiamine pyrophosphate-dependent acetolactate synthase large subunit-like protein